MRGGGRDVHHTARTYIITLKHNSKRIHISTTSYIVLNICMKNKRWHLALYILQNINQHILKKLIYSLENTRRTLKLSCYKQQNFFLNICQFSYTPGEGWRMNRLKCIEKKVKVLNHTEEEKHLYLQFKKNQIRNLGGMWSYLKRYSFS